MVNGWLNVEAYACNAVMTSIFLFYLIYQSTANVFVQIHVCFFVLHALLLSQGYINETPVRFHVVECQSGDV